MFRNGQPATLYLEGLFWGDEKAWESRGAKALRDVGEEEPRAHSQVAARRGVASPTPHNAAFQ